MQVVTKTTNEYVYSSNEELIDIINLLEEEAEDLRSKLILLIDKAPLNKRNYLTRLTTDWHGLWRVLYKDTLPIKARSIRQRIKAYKKWIKEYTP